MKIKLFLFAALFLGSFIFAQEIKIINPQTNEAIPDVALYNNSKTKSAVTDANGNASLDVFNASEKINFQHTSYQTISFTKSQIAANNNVVLLQLASGYLDEIVFSVTRFKQEKRDAPQKIISLSSQEALFSQPQTTADLLSNTGKIFVQKSQLGGGSPMMRGFSTNRLLMTVDGVRMNTAIFRGGNIQNILSIDPFVVENTEIILGPGSVVYGSDAVGGVMNFYTLQPKFSMQEGLSFSGNAVARYSSANEEKTGHLDFNFGFKEWAFLSSISYNDFDDLRMGSNGPKEYLRNFYISTINGEDVQVENSNPNIQKPTAYDQISVAQKVRFMPNEKWDFKLNLLYSETSDYARYDRLTRVRNGKLRDAEWFYGPQIWFSGNVQAENNSNNLLYDSSKIIVAYQRFEESRNNRSVNSKNFFNTEENVDAISANLDFTKKLSSVELFYGFEYVYNKVNSTGLLTNIETQETEETASRYPDGATWQSYAAYTSMLWKISPKLTFQSGLRYSYFSIDASFDNRFFEFPFQDTQIDTGNLTGSAGIAFQANETLGLRANFATAFRAPNIDDIGKIFDSEPGSVVVPNPNLEAEYAYNGEVGASLNFENVLKIDVATFYTKLDNALVRRDFNLNGETEIIFQGELSNVQAIQNAADARVYGFEASLVVNFSNNLQLLSNYTISNGYEVLDNGDEAPLRHAPPQFGNSHLVWKNNRLKIDVFARYSGQIRAENLAPSEANKPEIFPVNSNGDLYSPGWYTLNLATQYPLTDALQISASLENITDQRYRTYSSGISAPGRNFIAAMKYSF
ncbi:MAG: TonB-dependent receptor [Bacteroidetes bacterium HGW-Bacteroidetes-2]|jgi:hemoglobin/transferrin/lactoferrin receptor protein|nr:MAG: TonB-dependent receptor [Bacteroidetes bacterium HGW-Bacteroidetes-2]